MYLMLVNTGGDQPLRYLANLTSAEDLLLRLEVCRSGRCERILLSEPVTDSKQGSFQVLVGKNLEGVVRKSSQAYLLYIWDSREGKLNSRLKRAVEASYSELREESQGKLRLGAIDAGRNESPFLYVTQTPQLILYYYEEGRLTKNYFRGIHTSEEVTNFLKLHRPALFPDLPQEEVLALG
jgi:hypothetical protein